LANLTYSLMIADNS